MYFVTICTQNRLCLFGQIEDEFIPNSAGKMIQSVWNEIPSHYYGIELGSFVVMPNHVHAIIIITNPISVGAGPCACPRIGIDDMQHGQPQGVAPMSLSLPEIIHRYKTMTTKRYTDGVKNYGWRPFPGRLWQRNYYEHVIRNDGEHCRIAEYIANNPMCWKEDRLWIG